MENRTENELPTFFKELKQKHPSVEVKEMPPHEQKYSQGRVNSCDFERAMNLLSWLYDYMDFSKKFCFTIEHDPDKTSVSLKTEIIE
jgi:hypothetical protein